MTFKVDGTLLGSDNPQPAKINYMMDSSFKNVKFDSSIKNPWDMTYINNFRIHIDNSLYDVYNMHIESCLYVYTNKIISNERRWNK